jgi:hypothetical protein
VMILVYAGRRVDAAPTRDAAPSEARFPMASVPRVAREIAQLLERLKPSTVVGSAACGADLLVLEAAGALGVRRRVILPFDCMAFRARSVTDRPGDWGAKYDAVIADVSAKGDLVEMSLDAQGDVAYLRANTGIFDDATKLARSSRQDCRALVVWNGAPRETTDVTQAFLEEAGRRKWPLESIDTR